MYPDQRDDQTNPAARQQRVIIGVLAAIVLTCLVVVLVVTTSGGTGGTGGAAQPVLVQPVGSSPVAAAPSVRSSTSAPAPRPAAPTAAPTPASSAPAIGGNGGNSGGTGTGGGGANGGSPTGTVGGNGNGGTAPAGGQSQPDDQVSAVQADTTAMTMQQAAVAWVTAFNYGDSKALLSVSCRADIIAYTKQGATPSNYNGGIVLDIGTLTPNGTHGWVQVLRGGTSSNGVVSSSTALMVQQKGWKFCFTSGDPNNA